ncbi:MAG: hypothetical protein K8R36_12420, partial [Planctomycetales bacterium]|nr:hypothetical protein [Planctomycetales bacterium]
AIDTDERDRWDRAVKSYQGMIEELKRKVAELEAKLGVLNSSRVHAAERNARVSDEAPVENPPQGNANPESISQSLMHPTQVSNNSTFDESRTAQNTPAVNHTSPDSTVASPVQKALSDDQSDSRQPDFQSLNQVNLEQPKLGAGFPTPRLGSTAGLLAAEAGTAAGDLRWGVSAGSETRAEPSKPACISQSLMHPTPEPKYRWEDSFRQEALDYHCLKFGLPPATTDMAIGIPDPFKMSPRLWIERGYPYQIYIDRDIPCNRRNPLDTMGVIKLACHPVVNPEGW